MEVSKKNAASKSGRVYMLDEIRGFAILCMVVYHAMFNLKFSFGVDVPIFFESWFDIIRDIFAGAFIFISGIMCRYSHDNVRRGAQCFFLGMIISFVVPFFSADIKFGILHMLGISMMLYGLLSGALEKIPPIVGFSVFALLAAFTWNASNGFVGFGGSFRWDFPKRHMMWACCIRLEYSRISSTPPTFSRLCRGFSSFWQEALWVIGSKTDPCRGCSTIRTASGLRQSDARLSGYIFCMFR